MTNQGSASQGMTNQGSASQGMTNQGSASQGMTNQGSASQGMTNHATAPPLQPSPSASPLSTPKPSWCAPQPLLRASHAKRCEIQVGMHVVSLGLGVGGCFQSMPHKVIKGHSGSYPVKRHWLLFLFVVKEL